MPVPASQRGKISILVLVTLVILAATACRNRERPSLLLITLDTTRADHLGAYGYGRDTSPNLDRLAAGGVRFVSVMSQAAVTPVSHASILTGLQPYHHGLRSLHGYRDLRLRDDVRTLAEILRDRGYETAAVISAFPASSRFDLDRGFTHFEEGFLGEEETDQIDMTGIVNTGENQRRADETTRLAIEWLETNSRRPFFLWIHYFDPHDFHLLPPASYLEYCGVTAGTSREELISLYDCEIYFMDAQIGILLARLRALEPEGRTLVAVTADHGEGLGDHQWWSHGVLYREQIHLPLILQGAGLPAGKEITGLAQSIDILPTLLDILMPGTSLTAIDGLSRMEEIRGDGVADERFSYSESRNILSYAIPHSPGIRDQKDDELYSLIRGRWKYIHHRRRPEECELFDLVEDPEEIRNRYSSEPEIAQEFLALLESDPAIFAEGVLTPPNPEARERLRSLGYLEAAPENP